MTVLQGQSVLQDVARRCRGQRDLLGQKHAPLDLQRVALRRQGDAVSREVRVAVDGGQSSLVGQRQHAIADHRRWRNRHARDDDGKYTGIDAGFLQAKRFLVTGGRGQGDLDILTDRRIPIAVGIVQAQEHELAGVEPVGCGGVGNVEIQRIAVLVDQGGQRHEGAGAGAGVAAGQLALAAVHRQRRAARQRGRMTEETQRRHRGRRQGFETDGIAEQADGVSDRRAGRRRVLIGDAGGVIDGRRRRRNAGKRTQHRTDKCDDDTRKTPWR